MAKQVITDSLPGIYDKAFQTQTKTVEIIKYIDKPSKVYNITSQEQLQKLTDVVENSLAILRENKTVPLKDNLSFTNMYFPNEITLPEDLKINISSEPQPQFTFATSDVSTQLLLSVSYAANYPIQLTILLTGSSLYKRKLYESNDGINFTCSSGEDLLQHTSSEPLTFHTEDPQEHLPELFSYLVSVDALIPTHIYQYKDAWNELVNCTPVEVPVEVPIEVPTKAQPEYVSFEGYSGDTLDVSWLDTSKMTSFNSLFSSCSNITSLATNNFNTSKVKYMMSVFEDCTNLSSLNLSSWDTSNVTRMDSMFTRCQRIKSITFSDLFKTSKVTTMSSMFSTCQQLSSLDLFSFDTSNVTNMSNMFMNDNGLTQVNVSSFNTSKVTNMWNMFASCGGLTSLDLSNFNTSKVTNMNGMFSGCMSLTSLDISNFDISKVTNSNDMFQWVGRNNSSPTTVYVKDDTVQQWVLATEGVPEDWSTTNVIIKSAESETE